VAVKGSDAVTERPGFKTMLDRISGNGVRTIIVESPDRFARDLAVQLAGHHMQRWRFARSAPARIASQRSHRPQTRPRQLHPDLGARRLAEAGRAGPPDHPGRRQDACAHARGPVSKHNTVPDQRRPSPACSVTWAIERTTGRQNNNAFWL
jgi:Resolvase, N terminal domain